MTYSLLLLAESDTLSSRAFCIGIDSGKMLLDRRVALSERVYKYKPRLLQLLFLFLLQLLVFCFLICWLLHDGTFLTVRGEGHVERAHHHTTLHDDR